MPAPARIDVFAPITKRERDPKTGHLYVYGKMTGPDLDRDQQGMDSLWLKAAVPEWFQRGNIREQHDGKRAIGKALQLEEKPDGWYIGAKIVDKAAIEKVEEDVLTGFSIGIKGPRLDMTKTDYPRGLVTGGRICETSLVDVPCLPTATISDHWEIPLAKADDAGELQPVDEPELVRVEVAATAETYGLPAELYNRLASPVKQALADLAAAGAAVTAIPEDAAKAEDPATPVVVNVTVSGQLVPDTALADVLADAARQGAESYLERAEAADLLKGDFTAAQRRKMAASGEAMPDGSYPIPSKAYLRKAIRAVGRGSGDHNAIRRHILKRARALGLESMVPENWQADGSVKDTDAAKALLADLADLGFTPEAALGKADDDGAGAPPAQDVEDAKSAISIIAKLIVSEAQSLAVGNLNEACDISLLLQATNALKWFINAEQREPVDADGMDISLAEEPDLAKAGKAKNGGKLAPPFKKKGAPADQDEDEDGGEDGDAADRDDEDAGKKPAAKKTDDGALLTKAEAAEAIKAAVAEALAATPAEPETSPADEPEGVTKAELAEMIKTAVAEARTVDEERIETLTADLAKAQGEIESIKAQPVPGGPVLTRTSAQQAAATKSDAADLRAQAAELLEKAEKFSGNKDLAQGYRDRAKALLAKAAA